MRQKILLLNQVFYPDGAATAQHTTDLALYLTKLEYDVTVITGRRGYNDRETLYPKRETFQGIDIIRVGSTGLGKKNVFTRFLDGVTFEFLLLCRLLVTPRHDVVIVFTSPPLIGFVGALFCLFKGGRLVNWLMDINPDAAVAVGYLKKHSLLHKILNRAFEFSLKGSSNVVVLDRWMKGVVEGHGVPGSRITVIPPWPVQEQDRDKPKRFKAENPFREKYKLGGKFVILYSGNHSIVHPLTTLLEAAVRLKDEPDVVFVFIGGGLRVGDVTKIASEHNLKNILQLPHQPREMLDASLNLASLHVVVMGNSVTGLVHTSKIYGILATGAPYVAIAPKGSHLADLINECPFGFHVEHGAVDLLIDVIHKARKLSKQELVEIEQNNRSIVEKNFSEEISLGTFATQVLGVSTAEPQPKNAIPKFASISK
jgi:colanic acid biosynthesis glycosyl transferase WcaI